jgi:hypothetical protein
MHNAGVLKWQTDFRAWVYGTVQESPPAPAVVEEPEAVAE